MVLLRVTVSLNTKTVILSSPSYPWSIARPVWETIAYTLSLFIKKYLITKDIYDLHILIDVRNIHLKIYKILKVFLINHIYLRRAML